VHVVATAGHVDHGKSTLVRALTGQDPDRLEEERRRGLSIELGYAWTELAGAGEVAFVDVPGHERFIATTLAGLGPASVVMLVVAADDPWMPQAAEHLAAVHALGVTHGLLVVTRADLADPAAALAQARRELDATSLAGAPAVVVSGRTGAGLDELRARLVEVLDAVPSADPAADVRLWVDRRFHVKGTGTVVTGTLDAGTLTRGDQLEMAGERVRVRGIQSLGTAREAVSGPARVALDLGGRVPEILGRGTALTTPDAFVTATSVDVALVGQEEPPLLPLLHVGSAAVTVRVRPLGDGFARLALTEPLPLRVGDRALLRDPGSRALWGVEVVDPLPPPLRRRGAASARAVALSQDDGSVEAEIERRGVVRRSELRRLGVVLKELPAGTVEAGDWLLSPARASALRARLVTIVDAADPAAPAPTVAALTRRLGLPEPVLVHLLVAPPLRLERGTVLGRAHDRLPAALEHALAAVRASLAAAPFAAPDRSALRELGLDTRALAVLERHGHVLRLEDDVVLLPDAVEAAAALLHELPQPFSTSDARRALATSRRVAIPLLQHLDRLGRTKRLPDDRRVLLDQ
jgi:selenocysteine-specific elongation factor